MDSLLVLTGVTGLPELVCAPSGRRPTYISPTLAGLNETHPAVTMSGERARLGGWSARVTDGRLIVTGSGSAADWWRVAASAAWHHQDTKGGVVSVDGVTPPPVHVAGHRARS